MKLIDFYADWCGPCKMLSKTFEEFSKKHPDVSIIKINVENNEDKAEAWGVRNIPSVFLIDDTIQGTEPNFIRKFTGVKTLKDLEEFVYEDSSRK
jgi:thioredoxin 1